MVRSSVHPSALPFVHSFVRFICSFVRSLACSCVCSFVLSFVCSSMFCRSLDPDRSRTEDRTGPDRTGLEHLGPDWFQKTDPYHQIIIRSYHHIVISYHHHIIIASHHCIITISHHQDTVVIQTQAKSTENSKLHMPLFGEFGRSSRDLCHYGGYNAMNPGTIG